MNKHSHNKKCEQCGCSDVPPVITLSNGRETHFFCDHDCVREWIDDGEKKVLVEGPRPTLALEHLRRFIHRIVESN
jgi:hypothetical protein